MSTSPRRSLAIGAALSVVLGSAILVPTAQAADLDFEIASPYAAVDWQSWGTFKTGLHNHTTESDGGNTAKEMLEQAYALDYNLFAITDHKFTNTTWDRTDRPTENASGRPIEYLTTERVAEMAAGAGRDGAAGMIGVPNSNEQSRSDHINSFWTPWNNASGDSMESVLAMVEELGGMAHINHLGRYTGGVVGGDEGRLISNTPSVITKYTDLFTAYGSAVGMEIMNRPDNESKSDRILWDNLLMQVTPQRNIWGFSNDDAHSTGAIGRSYQYFLMPELTEDAARTAMESGAFYAIGTTAFNELGTDFRAEGPAPQVTDIVVDDEADTITISADNTTSVEWITDGRVIATGNTIDLDDHADEVFTYLRAQLKGPGGIAFLNPFTVTGGAQRPVIEVARVELTADGNRLDGTDNDVQLALKAYDAAGAELNLDRLTVAFQADTPNVLSISPDGLVSMANAPLANMLVNVRATVISGMSSATSAPVTIDVNVGAEGYYLMSPVRTGSDDIEEYANDGRMYFTSSDLEIVDENPGNLASRQTIGIRFDQLGLPVGAKVEEAYIQFTVDEPGKSQGPASVTINAEKIAHSPAFANEAYNASSRTRTDAEVAWNDIAPWPTAREAGEAQRTPDLSAILNELVAQDGWQIGNAVTFLIQGEGTRAADARERSAERGPVLHVRYSMDDEGGTPTEPTEGDIPVTAQIPQIGGAQPGSLVLSVAEGGVDLGQARNAGDRLRLSGTLPQVSVTDTRVDSRGWNLAGSSSDLAADAAAIRAGHLGWAPFLVSGDATPGAKVQTVMSAGAGLAAPASLGSSAGGTGTDALAADLELEVPVDTRAGTYTGSVTLSLFPLD